MQATMSAREAAHYLGISYWLLLENVKKRQIPHVRIGGRVLFRQETLGKWLTEQEVSSLRKESGIRKLY